MVWEVSLEQGDLQVATYAMTDSGAEGVGFVDKNWAIAKGFQLEPMSTPLPLINFNGLEDDSASVTHFIVVSLRLHDHLEKDAFLFVTTLSHYPIILGIPWLKVHDPEVKFGQNTLLFNSEYCQKNCNTPLRPTRVHAVPDVPPKDRPENVVRPVADPEPVPASDSLDIQPVSLLALSKFANRGLTIYQVSLEQVEDALNEKSERTAVELPVELEDYCDVFSPKEAEKLPPHRPYDHDIKLKDGQTPPWGPLYPMSKVQLKTLKEWLEENLRKGFIRPSSSPASSPVLFVAKPDGSLRLCMDYRGLNAVSEKDRYPLPLTKETLNSLKGMKYFSKIDIVAAFNNIRIKKGLEYLTAFRTKLGLFESLVMPFGLTGAPATWQRFMNDLLRPYIDLFCQVYLDDILIYSKTRKEHENHLRQILEVLRQNKLYAKPSKCEFFKTEVIYLGFILGVDGIRMDPAKVETIVNWQPPKNVTDVKSFTGFAGFYRRWIKDFSRILAPITALERKNTKFEWTPKCQQAFDFLKEAFTREPVLKHFDWDKPAILETDASDYVCAGVLSQYDDEGVLHPVAFYSKKMTPAECNYEIYDKELLAIIRCLEEWSAELEMNQEMIKILCDHRNLEYFMSTKMLNRRQARWSEFLSRFNFTIVYRPGKQGVKPDSLTRRSEDMPKEGDERLLHQSQTVLKRENLPDFPPELIEQSDMSAPAQLRTTALDPATPPQPTQSLFLPDWLKELLQKGYETDPLPSEVLEALDKNLPKHPQISLAECSQESELLFYRQKLYIPDLDELKATLLQEAHDNPSAGHPGRNKTYELLQRHFYWPGMYEYVKQWVKNCHTCQRITPSREGHQGVLKPLSVPGKAWKDLSMDFITHLPESNGFDAILVVVCRLTKFRRIIPCKGTCGAEELARLFRDNIWRSFGLPNTIVSDRGAQFISAFWGHLNKLLNTRANLSTAWHPESDGQTERMNAILEQYLRAYVSYLQDDWSEWLAAAEFAGNSQVSETTRISPFFALYGFEPRFGFEPVLPDKRPATRDAALFAKQMQKIHEHCQTEIIAAHARWEDHVNKKRKPARKYLPGDKVWLNARNIQTLRPQKKLDWKNLGPFVVKQMVSSHACELELPATMRVHPVFNVHLLRPASEDFLPGQRPPEPPPIEVEGIEQWEVEEVVDSLWKRRGRGKPKLYYVVKWVGYPETNEEPAENLENAAELVRNFHRRYPNKPGPDKRFTGVST
ncbi:hypothetical protein KCU65_g10168, partial [Aureobasidium melanogenum]